MTFLPVSISRSRRVLLLAAGEDVQAVGRNRRRPGPGRDVWQSGADQPSRIRGPRGDMTPSSQPVTARRAGGVKCDWPKWPWGARDAAARGRWRYPRAGRCCRRRRSTVSCHPGETRIASTQGWRVPRIGLFRRRARASDGAIERGVPGEHLRRSASGSRRRRARAFSSGSG